MSHANQLFTLNATGEPIPASSEDIIAAAREHLSRRLRRGTSLSCPQAVRDYLAVRLGAREFESFCCLFLDLCGPQNNVEPDDFPLLFLGFRCSELHITTAVRSGVTSRRHRFGRCRREHPGVDAARPGRLAPTLYA